MLNQDWDINPLGKKCDNCGASFADHQSYVSRLCFGKDGYQRHDFCQDCWTRRDESGATVSVWRGLFKAPPPPPAEPVKKETAETLLRRMMADGGESYLNVIFVLAVMLERRRVFVEREVKHQPDGARLRVYEHRGTGEIFMIRDPMLRLDSLRDIQREVLAMLGGDGEKAGG